MGTSEYKRIILPQAEEDIREILDYISEELHNPEAAVKLLAAMANAMESVSLFRIRARS